MAHALTEDSTNADLDTGVSVPDNGDSGSIWWDNLIATIQQLADRTQRTIWTPDTQSIHVPMKPMAGDGTNFDLSLSSDKICYEQTTLSSTVGIYFAIPQLPAGRKITGVTAYWQNAVALKKVIIAVGTASPNDTEVGVQADSTAVLADYQKVHTIALTGLNETIAEDAEYYIEFAGESGTNAELGGKLWGLRVALAR